MPIGSSVGRGGVNQSVDVRTVQSLINRQGMTAYSYGQIAVDGVVGPQTISAIENYQSRVVRMSRPDGRVDPGGVTIRTLEQNGSGNPGGSQPGTSSNLAEAAVTIALGEDGVREQPIGSNSGPKVDAYLRSVGINQPALWCMAFVYWCFNQASSRVGQPNPMLKTASCTNLYSWAASHNKLVSTPQRGDIFLVRGGAQGRTHQHTGIVTSVSGGSIGTIEGNTNNDGSSNGIGVFRRTRSTGNLDFVRP